MQLQHKHAVDTCRANYNEHRQHVFLKKKKGLYSSYQNNISFKYDPKRQFSQPLFSWKKKKNIFCLSAEFAHSAIKV